jgi:very-short-patch-repair endonuclease
LDDVEIIIKKHKVIIEFDGSYWHKNKADQDLARQKY